MAFGWRGNRPLSAPLFRRAVLEGVSAQNESTFTADGGLAKKGFGSSEAPAAAASDPRRDQRQAQGPWRAKCDPTASVH